MQPLFTIAHLGLIGSFAGIEPAHLPAILPHLASLKVGQDSGFVLKVAMQAVKRFGVSVSQGHLDSTSFALDGEYPSANGANVESEYRFRGSAGD